ncbi:hypothetical protein ACN2XU_18620 [Primorskyibacter sp. 2E107]|uniref:hypothetical protein n=1 Tax=Primorskyibacter sp. 2E107 TaxID=3403458 RepID=UPI003AF48FE5
MTKRKDDKLWSDAAGLDDFFEAAKADAPLPSGDFMARIEAQAVAVMPAPRRAPPAPAPGLLRQLLHTFGGWPGAAGLVSACAVGLWIGISPPASLSGYLGLDAAGLDSYGVEPMSGFDLAMMEG